MNERIKKHEFHPRLNKLNEVMLKVAKVHKPCSKHKKEPKNKERGSQHFPRT